MLLGILILASPACNKLTPQLHPPATKNSITSDSAKNRSQSRSGNCFPGQALATSGEFYWPIDSTQSNAVQIVVYLAHYSDAYNLGELRDRKRRFLASVCNLEFYTENLQYFVNGSLYDLHGNIMFQVQDNKWKIFRNTILRYNYDANGFELYDKAGRIALSINLRDLNYGPIIYCRVISPCTSTTLEYSSPNFFYTDIPYGTKQSDHAFDSLYHSDPILPLFRYTGRDWQHARL
jgi:hypothetical protein